MRRTHTAEMRWARWSLGPRPRPALAIHQVRYNRSIRYALRARTRRNRTLEEPEMPIVGETAPEFSLRGARGDEFRLADLRGRSAAVLFFYPRDRTSG